MAKTPDASDAAEAEDSDKGAIRNTMMGMLPFATGIVLASLLYFLLPFVLPGRAGP